MGPLNFGVCTRAADHRPNKLQVAPTASEQQQDAALQDGRVEWAKQMRLAFSPGGMLFEDGTINQAFFKPKMVRGSSQLLRVVMRRRESLIASAMLVARRQPMLEGATSFGRESYSERWVGPHPSANPPLCARFFSFLQVVVQEDKRWGEKEKDLLYKVRVCGMSWGGGQA